MIRLTIIDDHPVVTQGLERYLALESDVQVVGVFANLEPLEAIVSLAPTVVSLDVHLGGPVRPERVEQLSRQAPVLLFTLQPPDDTAAALVRAGAAGYLSKSSSMSDYVQALRALHHGKRHLPPSLQTTTDAAQTAPPHAALTPREQQVLVALARGGSIKEVAARLGIASSTLYTHAERVRRKIGVAGPVELARYAERWGLL